MDIRFSGTGGAFHVDQGNSSALVTVGTSTFLVDCGHAVFPKLVKTGAIDRIDAVLVTHLHDDHVGSLSSLILYYFLVLKKGRMKIIYQSDAFRHLLEQFLSFSIGPASHRVEYVPISDYPNLGAIDTFGKHVPNMPTWAFYFREEDEVIVFSGDLGSPEPLFSELAKLNLPGKPIVFHEMAFVESFGHTYYKDLFPYLDDYEIYGYHHDERENPAENPIPLVVNTPKYLL